MDGTEYCIVYITAGSEDEAGRIASALVERRLAACVNIIPSIRSVYRWKGKIETEPEVMMVAKTRAEKFEALRKAVLEAHSYEVPEIIAVPITGGEPSYLKWICDSVGTEDE